MNTSLGSKLLLSNSLSMLNKNLTGFMQSLFSVQSICTVRKGSASRVLNKLQGNIMQPRTTLRRYLYIKLQGILCGKEMLLVFVFP